MIKTKIFSSRCDSKDLTKMINDYIRDMMIMVIDIKFSSTYNSFIDEVEYSAMLIYKGKYE